MLFDLFACFDLSAVNIKIENPFNDLEAYKKLMFAEQEDRYDNAYLLSLHKRHDDNFPVHSDSHYDVRIFGYCFVRTDNTQLKDRSRLSANRIAQIYEEHGVNFIKKIKGSFSILIFDKCKKEVLIFTDPLNIRPFYHYQKGQELIISSSLSALSKHIKNRKQEVELNYPAIIEYSIFGYILNDDTYLKDVFMVPPGSVFKYAKEEVQISKYWDVFKAFNDLKIEHTDEQRAVDKLEILLKKNLNLYLFDPDRTAMSLTGGLNTRTNVALLGNKSKDFLFYNYGTENNYDISISKKIAKTVNLRFKPIFFDETFQKSFNKNTELALGLGDGMAEVNHLNSLYAFKEIGKSYDYILTGLFGTELLTAPGVSADYMNAKIHDLLKSGNKEEAIEEILNDFEEVTELKKETVQLYREEVKNRIINTPLIVNDHKLPEKYLYFLLMIGIRKVFMKEVKIERPFIENLHPFFDIEYIELLLKTPFAWLHSWTGIGSAAKSTQSDKLFAYLIDRNKPRLNNILSTTGYTPKYLMNSFYRPVIKLEHFYHKNRMKQKVDINTEGLMWEYFDQNRSLDFKVDFIDEDSIKRNNNAKNPMQLSALKHWLFKNDLVKE